MTLERRALLGESQSPIGTGQTADQRIDTPSFGGRLG